MTKGMLPTLLGLGGASEERSAEMKVLPEEEATLANPKPEGKWRILESFLGATVY